MDPALQSALRKAGWRFMPLLVAAYALNYLDRTCIGFAALTMNRDLGLSASQFGLGAGVFFLSYAACELPSNAALHRFGARKWLSRIMITWGLASAATALVVGPRSFYAVRFILGICEAGFFPGAVYFLSLWFPPQHRARFLALLLLAIPLSSVVGGPLCGLLLQMDGALGVAGWKWLFVALSLPCVVLGLVALAILRDRPETADWLTQEERDALTNGMAAEARISPKSGFWSALTDGRAMILAGVQFGYTLGSYAIGIWLPLILKGFHLSNLAIGFIAALPYVVASVGSLAWAWRVDRHGHAILAVASGCFLAAAGLVWTVTAQHSLAFSLLAISLGLTGISAARAIFWSIPTRFMVGAGAAGGLAFINCIGTVGGFFGPVLMGWLKDVTGSFQIGTAVVAGIMLATAMLAASLKLLIPKE